MRKVLHTWFVLSILLLSTSDAALAGPGQQIARPRSGNVAYGYYEYLPQNYSATSGERFPLVVFVHGYGERGNGSSTELTRLLSNGPPRMISQGRHFPAIVISLQSNYGDVWDTNAANTLNGFINYLIQTYAVDEDRIYLTGLSQGGGATLQYAKQYASRLAAIVPVCPWHNDTGINDVAMYEIPYWGFHAYGDTTVSVQSSNRVLERITGVRPLNTYPGQSGDFVASWNQLNQNWGWQSGRIGTLTVGPHLTVFPDNSHDSWTRAYDTNQMWTWLFNQSLNSQPQPEPTPTPTPTPSPSPSPTPPPASLQAIAVDFGGVRSSAGGINVLDNGAGTTAQNLVDISGTVTPVDIQVSGFSGTNTDGTPSPSPTIAFDANSTRDSFWGSTVAYGGVTSPQGSIVISGLEQDQTYSLEFFASRMGATDNRSTRFEVIGNTTLSGSLNAANNTSQTLVIVGVTPNSSGEIRITVRPDAQNNNAYRFFYVGALRLTPSEIAEPEPVSETFAVDFGGADRMTAGSNNLTDAKNGRIDSLVNVLGESSDLSVHVVQPFSGINTDGTQSPSASLGLTSSATSDSFWGNNVTYTGELNPQGRVEVRGLDPTITYDLSFFASRMNVTDNRETRYRVSDASGERSVTLAVNNNQANAASLTQLRPRADGTLLITVDKGANNNNAYGFFYLGHLRIQSNP